jgi:hypothetical protein
MFTPTHLWRWNRYSVPNRRLIPLTPRSTTQKTLFYIHTPAHLWRWNRYSVPKRRLVKFRRRGTTQKTIYYVIRECESFTRTQLWRWNRHCSEMSAYKIQTPGNHPEENILHDSWMWIIHTYPPMKMEPIVCSETSAYKIQTPGNHPEDNILHDSWMWIIHTYRPMKMEPIVFRNVGV